MLELVKVIVSLAVLMSAAAMGIADFMLRRERLPQSTRSQVGVAPFRWFRPELFRPESRWLARLAKRACALMLILSVVLFIVARL